MHGPRPVTLSRLRPRQLWLRPPPQWQAISRSSLSLRFRPDHRCHCAGHRPVCSDPIPGVSYRLLSYITATCQQHRQVAALAGVDSPLGGVVLLTPELVETSTRGEQLVDRAVLDDLAGVEEKNPVGVTDTGQPMGDDHPGPWLRIRGERIDDRSLILGVQCAGRLVDQQYR